MSYNIGDEEENRVTKIVRAAIAGEKLHSWIIYAVAQRNAQPSFFANALG